MLCLGANDATRATNKLSDIQRTPDDSNLQGKLKIVRLIGSSSYRELMGFTVLRSKAVSHRFVTNNISLH